MSKELVIDRTGPALLAASLYPAVWFEFFLERFQVVMGEAAGGADVSGAAAAQLKRSTSLLSVCFAQAQPLRKALAQTALPMTAVTPGREAGAVVPRAVFIAAVKSLVSALGEAAA